MCFGELRIWRDADENHQTDAGELRSLADFDIASLNTGYEAIPEFDNGNLLLERSTATRTDGSSMAMVDAYFAVPTDEPTAVPPDDELAEWDARIVIESLPADNQAPMPEIPLGIDPILVDPSRVPDVASGGGEDAAAVPLILWDGLAGSDVAASETLTGDSLPTQSTWLDDVLGLAPMAPTDLATATGLVVTVKEGV